MTFAADRDPKSSKRSGTARGASLAGRNSNEPIGGSPMDPARRIEEGRPVPIGEVIAARERQIDAAERIDNGIRLAAVTDDEPVPVAAEYDPDLEQEVKDLSAALRIVESKLLYLRGAVDEKSLAARVLDVMGMSAAEVRHQVPALRQAIRDEARS